MKITRIVRLAALPALTLLLLVPALAVASGSLSGVIRDPTGAVVTGAKLTLVNSALKTQYQTTSDARGFYSFPVLPVASTNLRSRPSGSRDKSKPPLPLILTAP